MGLGLALDEHLGKREHGLSKTHFLLTPIQSHHINRTHRLNDSDETARTGPVATVATG